MRQYNVIVSFRFGFVYTERFESFKRTIRFVCLFCLVAERRKNDCIENKRSRGLRIRLGALFKRVVLGRIRCFCFSQAAIDVQQVQATTNSPLCARMGYKPPTICHMLRKEGLIVNRMGVHKLLRKHRETNNI